MKVAFIASEIFPYAKTGGLADVAGSLPKSLEKLGCEVKLFMPKYYSINDSKYGLHYNWDIGEIVVRVGDHLRPVYLHQSKLQGSNVEVIFIDCPHYFYRKTIYTEGDFEGESFILFVKAVLESMQSMKWTPDVIHCNDWQTGVLPLYLKANYSWDKMFEKTATLFTIHNIGYQGRFSKNLIKTAEVDEKYFYPTGPTEYDGDFSFMKTALSFSDIITTVSKSYANEILTPEYGSGMEGVLNKRKNDLYGILNGIDYSNWDQEKDIFIPHHYSPIDLTGKKKNKEFLLKQFRLNSSKDVPLIGIISRMAIQKGFDIFAGAVKDLMKMDVNWIILGSGEEIYEEMFHQLAQKYPKKVAVHIGFNNELSHLIEAAADMFLMPSKYEPCGLNQIYSLKYGTVPIVRKTGGLADTVRDWDEYSYKNDFSGNGFSFNDYSSYALTTSVERAAKYYKDKTTWSKIQQNGMEENFSWEVSAEEYLDLYHIAIEKRK